MLKIMMQKMISMLPKIRLILKMIMLKIKSQLTKEVVI